MATFTYQNTATLTTIANNLIPSLTMDDPIFSLFPMVDRQAWSLRWEIKDNYPGLMKLRGIGGEPTPITRVGSNIYEAEPGAYGQFGSLDEKELTMRARPWPGDMEQRVPVNDMVSEIQASLLTLAMNRTRQLSWALAIAGTFSVALPNGGIGHTATVTLPGETVSPLWSATTTATPLLDLLELQNVYGRGTSNSFAGGATAWMNSKTANYLLVNSNALDIGGRLVQGGNTINDLNTINTILLNRGCPQIKIYDDGYLNDAGTFTLFIPDGKVLIVGQRPGGETPGQFQRTYNAISGTTGAYSEILDHSKGPSRQIPPKIEVHGGWNGGPVLLRPTQLIVLTVA